MDAPPLVTSHSLDFEGSHGKRESILSMAVSGVRNLLVVSANGSTATENDRCIEHVPMASSYSKANDMLRSKSMRTWKSHNEVDIHVV